MEDAFLQDGLHLSTSGKERLAIGILNIIYRDLRDTITYMTRFRVSTRIINLPPNLNYRPALRVQNRTIFFKGENSIISNFTHTNLSIFGKEFTTSESAYQYAKAAHSGDITMCRVIQKERTGRGAKSASRRICITNQQHWHSIKRDIMKYILMSKMDQDTPFRFFLLENKVHSLSEDTLDNFGL